jgi:hypothetical protein
MCDYSLQHVATRAAKVGDNLFATQFVNSITRGFSAIEEPSVAVCLLPGTELVFDREVECDRALGFLPNKKLRECAARFRQINLENACEHHDAVEFPGDQVVLLTRLWCGPARHGIAATGRRASGRQVAGRRGRPRGPAAYINRTGPRLKSGALRTPATHEPHNGTLHYVRTQVPVAPSYLKPVAFISNSLVVFMVRYGLPSFEVTRTELKDTATFFSPSPRNPPTPIMKATTLPSLSTNASLISPILTLD